MHVMDAIARAALLRLVRLAESQGRTVVCKRHIAWPFLPQAIDIAVELRSIIFADADVDDEISVGGELAQVHRFFRRDFSCPEPRINRVMCTIVVEPDRSNR